MIKIWHEGEYINFTCEECRRDARVINAQDDFLQDTFDTRKMHIMQIDLKCEGCGAQTSVKMKMGFQKG